MKTGAIFVQAFEKTRLWRATLGDSYKADDYVEHRTRLSQAYLRFRERAALLARKIEYDLPEFAVHDVTHLDALWELADLIAGPVYSLTPSEAFVFGGAILIHDLGMALAAYPEGIEELKKIDLWEDIAASILRKKLGRAAYSEEIRNPDTTTIEIAKAQILRELHAERAAQLGLISWHDLSTGNEFHLIEDVELRSCYGALIGKIAQSHWLSVSQLGNLFAVQQGAPGSLPHEWTVDPLKLACLLRTADASHLDERRAPLFLRALQKPAGLAAQHWTFQAKLNQPRMQTDRLIYTSSNSFNQEEADSWWLCYEALQIVDTELREVDALLADLGRPRLAAVGVCGVESPERLARYIPPLDWFPVDVQVKITDVASLITSLGGENLYGRNKTIPLRELIQNASDAVRARRLLESRPSAWGEVVVRLGEDGVGHWIEVEDTGVGMSAEVLSGPFLDFGKSGWDSEIIIRELPTLLSSGFESTGKYGIGFFSVFMWGEKVQIITRRYDAALSNTLQMDFTAGLASRPLLKKATSSNWLRDGGTRIRVWLQADPFDFDGFLHVKETHHLRVIEDRFGQPMGRACIVPDIHHGMPGVVTVGGLRANDLSGMSGILLGQSVMASRLAAKPIVNIDLLRAWATEQASLISKCIYLTPEQKMKCDGRYIN